MLNSSERDALKVGLRQVPRLERVWLALLGSDVPIETSGFLCGSVNKLATGL